VAAQLHAVYNGSLEATAVSAVPVMDGSGYDSDEWADADYTPEEQQFFDARFEREDRQIAEWNAGSSGHVMDGSGYDSDEWADADYTPEEQQFFDARFEREDRQIAEWNAGSGGHVMDGSGYDSDEWADADYTPEEQQFFDARFEREDRQIAEWNARHDAGPATAAATDATGAGRGPDQINRATVTRPVLASRLRTHTLSVLKTRPVEIVGAAPPSRGAGAIGALIASAAKLFSLPVMVDHAVAKTQATRMTLPDAPDNRGSDA
jgi:succinate dehydrogenase flavin-adding protein (antitoxin of CptAB toxin-antitoxin module)